MNESRDPYCPLPRPAGAPPPHDTQPESPPPQTGTPRPRRGWFLLRDSSIYLLGNLLQKAAAFILIPVYTRALTVAQYGILELANTVVNLLLVAAALGVPSAINKCYHRDCHDETDRGRLVGTALLFTVCVTLALALLGWAAEGWLSNALFSGPEGLVVYRYTLVWLVLAQIAVVPFEWARASGRSSLFVGMSLAQLAVQFVAIVLLTSWGGLGLRGVLAGNVLGLVAVNLAGAVLLMRTARFEIDPRLLKAMSLYGLAMIPVFLSGWVVNVSDRFFVKSLAGLDALGIYALGYKFGALVDLLIVMPFQRAWTPLFFGMAKEPRAASDLARVTTYLVGILGVASLAVSLGVVPFLRVGATPGYYGASDYVPMICLAYLIGGVANCLANGLIVAGKMRQVAGYALLAALTNLALNALLIPWLGAYGAAVATVLAFAVQCTGILISLSRHFPVNIEWGRISRILLACGIPFLLSYVMPVMSFAVDVASRICLLITCLVLLFVLRLVRPEDVAAVKRQIVAMRGRRPSMEG